MDKIKKKLKNIGWIYSTYRKYKFRFYFDDSAKLYFPGNKKDKKKVALILAGYKEQLWDVVFNRLKSYLPDDYDVCIVSSGKYSANLYNIAKNNGWSYLSIKRNNVCLALNTSIARYDHAEYILKIDEDIFVSKHTVREMENAYDNPVVDYNPGIVAPMIPINGFSYVEVLRSFNNLNKYEERFGKAIHGAGSDKKIENDPEVAKFFWRMSKLDDLDESIFDQNKDQIACPIRFSIGIIYFERNLWVAMDYFHVHSHGNDMGYDEEKIDEYCFINSRPIVVSKNAIAGHLSFGKQNNTMYDFFANNKKVFEI